MIPYNRIRDMLQKRGLSGSRRSHDQSPLSFPDRRHQIHDARRIPVRNGLQANSFQWIDRSKFLEDRQGPILFGIFGVNQSPLKELRPATAPANFTLDPQAVTQCMLSNYLRCNKDILRRLGVVSLWIS